jgi:hypothetical protein
VGRALATVNDVEVLEGELELAGEVLDAGADFSVGEGRELVEEGLDLEGSTWNTMRVGFCHSLRVGKTAMAIT